MNHCILDSFVAGIHFSVSYTKLRVEFFLDYGALLLKEYINENFFILCSVVSRIYWCFSIEQIYHFHLSTIFCFLNIVSCSDPKFALTSFSLYMLSFLCLLCPEGEWTFEFGKQKDDHHLTSFSTSFPVLNTSPKMKTYLSFMKKLE